MAPTADDHGRVVLSAIIPDRRDLLDRAQRHLTPEHFPDLTLRNIFLMLERYAEATGAVLTRTALADILRTADPGKALLYQETFDSLQAQTVSDDEFKWSLTQVRELAAERATMEALTEGMEVLRTGLTKDRRELSGHHDSRLHVLEKFAEIDRNLSMQESPEGDARREREEILREYAERKQAHLTGRSRGVLFSIPELDMKTGGLQNGDLCLVAGYSSDGKTSLCVQLAWSAAVEQGLNVVFLTTETLRPQVIRKMLSRHSMLPLFDLPQGLNSRDLKNGTLPDDLEDKYQEVVADFTSNPAYGKMYVTQVPRGATLATCESRLYRYQRDFDVHLVVMDYLALLRSERRRTSDREELGLIVKEAKQLATTFDDGRGVPFVSPWQVNRTARDQAERAGYYSSSAMAETAEATNSSDVIVSVLAPSDNDSRYTEAKLQALKNRDGETASSILVDVDYATSTFRAKRAAASLDELIEGPGTTGDAEFAGLLG